MSQELNSLSLDSCDLPLFLAKGQKKSKSGKKSSIVKVLCLRIRSGVAQGLVSRVVFFLRTFSYPPQTLTVHGKKYSNTNEAGSQRLGALGLNKIIEDHPCGSHWHKKMTLRK